MIDLMIRQGSRLWKDDRGADLIEYGLIAGIIAAAGVAAFPSIFSKLDVLFETWGTNVYNAWEPNDPIPQP
jgi:Flp pilus assembly pilin Flp